MKFQTPLLLLATLISYISAEAAGGVSSTLSARIHSRDFPSDTISPLEPLDLQKRGAPSVPKGKDGTKLHVWIRTDSRPSSYDDRSGASHEGLNQLMKDTGGRHKDVVVGNSKGFYEYGLQFSDKSWVTKPNGDGAAVSGYAGLYDEVEGGREGFEYRGQVKDGRKTLKSIVRIAEVEIKGKTYNHKTYNCETFAVDLAKKLVENLAGLVELMHRKVNFDGKERNR